MAVSPTAKSIITHFAVFHSAVRCLDLANYFHDWSTLFCDLDHTDPGGAALASATFTAPPAPEAFTTFLLGQSPPVPRSFLPCMHSGSSNLIDLTARGGQKVIRAQLTRL